MGPSDRASLFLLELGQWHDNLATLLDYYTSYVLWVTKRLTRLPLAVHADLDFLQELTVSDSFETVEQLRHQSGRGSLRPHLDKIISALRTLSANGIAGTRVLAFGEHCSCVFFEACIVYNAESSSMRYFCINVRNPEVVILKLPSVEGPFTSLPRDTFPPSFLPIFAYFDVTDFQRSQSRDESNTVNTYSMNHQRLEKTVVRQNAFCHGTTKQENLPQVNGRHEAFQNESSPFRFLKLPPEVQDLFYELLLESAVYVVDCADHGKVNVYMEDAAQCTFRALTRTSLAIQERLWAQIRRSFLRSVPILQMPEIPVVRMPGYDSVGGIRDETWQLLSHFKHIKVKLSEIEGIHDPQSWISTQRRVKLRKLRIISVFNAHLPRLKTLDIIVPVPKSFENGSLLPSEDDIRKLSYHDRLHVTFEIWTLQEVTYNIPSMQQDQSSLSSQRRHFAHYNNYSRWPPSQWSRAVFQPDDLYSKHAMFRGDQFPIEKLRKLRSCAIFGNTVPVTLLGPSYQRLTEAEVIRFKDAEMHLMEQIIPRNQSRPITISLHTLEELIKQIERNRLNRTRDERRNET